jgi:hypothetical protein
MLYYGSEGVEVAYKFTRRMEVTCKVPGTDLKAAMFHGEVTLVIQIINHESMRET